MTAATMSQPVAEMKNLHLQDKFMVTNDGSSSMVKDPITARDGATAPTTDEATSLLEGPYSRTVGDTEHNWCRAVSSGTGITVLALLFSRVVEPSALQQAASLVQLRHPRLRSHLLWIQGRPAFKVSEHPSIKVEIVDATLSLATGVVPEQNSKNHVSGDGEECCAAEQQDGENNQDNRMHVSGDGEECCAAEEQDGQNNQDNKMHVGEDSVEYCAAEQHDGENNQDNKKHVSEGAEEYCAAEQHDGENNEDNKKHGSGDGEDCCAVEQQDGENNHVSGDADGHGKERDPAELQDGEKHVWMDLVETELNENMWPEHQHCLEPIQMFVVRLYLLPENRSLLVLRVHTAVCDRVAAATVLVDILTALRETTAAAAAAAARDTDGAVSEDPSQPSSGADQLSSESAIETGNDLKSVEDGIPPGKANKPFWAHGIDLLGYSLGTRRHALLPFHEPEAPRRSKFFHSILSVEHTRLLLQACEKRNCSLHGALSAAGMKAAAAIKSLGNRSEHFAIISLVNCRQLLEPVLSDSAVGFYHSAIMNTHHVNEQTDFWDLAKRSSRSVDNAMKNRKHFTDMGDLNFLMFQALQHPGLTPSSSMRTSLLVVFRETIVDEMEDLAESLAVEHYVGCSSIHGVGPTLAIFDSVRKGALHFSGVYPNPLYSRTQMCTYVTHMVNFLVGSFET